MKKDDYIRFNKVLWVVGLIGIYSNKSFEESKNNVLNKQEASMYYSDVD